MIDILILCAAALIVVLAVKRVGFLSPTGIVSTMVAMNMLVFYVIETIKLDASSALILSHSYKFRSSYWPMATDTLTVYLIFLVILASTAWRVKRYGGRNLALDKLAALSSEKIVLTGGAVLLGLCVAHAGITELRFLGDYTVYLQVRDPEFYGVTNGLAAMVVGNIGFVGVLSAALLSMAVKTGRAVLIMVLFAVFIYTGLFQAAAHSRWLVLQMAIAIVLLARNQNLLSRVLIVLLLLILPYAYYAAIMSRSNNVYGLETMLQFSFADISEVLLVNTFGNIFGGGLVLSEAMTRLGTAYPLSYQVLSFSPLPSAIDSFAALKRVYEVRINVFGPFSAVAETYWFGPAWMAAYFFIVAQSLKCVENMWQQSKASNAARKQILAYIAFGLTLYGHVLMHQYPLRNSIRWIWLAWLIYPFFAYRVTLFAQSARRLSAKT